MNYWIFQGKPKAYKFQSAIKKELLKEWTVKQHVLKIKKGDKALIWICGDKPGIYGVVDILSNPAITEKADDNGEWVLNDETGKRHQNEDGLSNKVNIEFIHSLFQEGQFIPGKDIPNTTGALSTLKSNGFIQGKTNLISSQEQFQMVVDLINKRNN